MELFEQIRKARDAEHLGIRALERRFGVHRRTVRQALASAVPPPRRQPDRVSPALGPWTRIIDDWLAADKTAPRKQRHTARRIWQRLVEEHGATLGESSVRRYVSAARRSRPIELAKVNVVQAHLPGAGAEVDFGAFMAVIDGENLRLWMFCMRLSASGRGFHVAFAHQAQEAFLEGHRLAFAHFDGAPGRIRYDNLKPAVAKVLLGRDRVEAERFTAMRSHYSFDSFFCRPGIEGAHERGSVEGEIGRFRRRHLVPVPKVGSLAELNEAIAAGDVADDARFIGARRQSVGGRLRRRGTFPAPFAGRGLRLFCRAVGQGRHQGAYLRASELLLGAGEPGRATRGGATARFASRGCLRRPRRCLP